jgi:hypothetical protein
LIRSKNSDALNYLTVILIENGRVIRSGICLKGFDTRFWNERLIARCCDFFIRVEILIRRINWGFVGGISFVNGDIGNQFLN